MSALSPHVCRQAGTGQISSLPSLRLLPRGFQCSWMSPVWPVLGLLTRPTARSPECNGYSGMTLHHHWRKRLSDPKDVRAGCAFAAALLGLEALVCVAIITRVPYTEIDWQAYMQQSRTFSQGERDYSRIRGSTGPLVYPAGFLYLFSALRWLTHDGQVALAQIWFAVLFLVTQAIVLLLYIRSKVVPPWALALLCASRRLHSIFLLRMFNDGPVMCIAYMALALLETGRCQLSVLVFSAAVSIKMNVLLMAPPVLSVMLQVATVAELAWASLAGLLLQMLLAWPFLVQAPVPYLTRAFQLSRAFSHVWSVNLKFLPEHIFLSQKLALGLLIVHVILLLAFAQICLHRQSGGIAGLLQRFVSSFSTPKLSRHLGRQPPAGRAFGAVLAGNFIGVLCARSLHFQFYCWYCHSLPFLLWQTRLGCCRKVVLWLCIELIWNIYPSSGLSSVALQACHLVLLAAMFADSNAWHL